MNVPYQSGKYHVTKKIILILAIYFAVIDKSGDVIYPVLYYATFGTKGTILIVCNWERNNYQSLLHCVAKLPYTLVHLS